MRTWLIIWLRLYCMYYCDDQSCLYKEDMSSAVLLYSKRYTFRQRHIYGASEDGHFVTGEDESTNYILWPHGQCARAPDPALRVRALVGDIVLCSWERHLTVPLSTLVYNKVPAN